MLGLIYIFNPLAQNKLSDKLIILLIMKVCFSCFTAYAKYGGGTGEPNDPYLICTAEQMNTIGAEPNDWDKHFKLIADIDLSNGFQHHWILAEPVPKQTIYWCFRRQ
jgi:hypothetical protein